MAKFLDSISTKIQEFIEKQKVFFVATAANTGSINLSPKGMDTLRVVDSKTIVWLNLTGSGNETAAHLLLHNRMTIMFCSFDDKPLILRLYGTAETYHAHDEQYQKWIKSFPEIPGARQIFVLNVERLQTSCGFAVPIMDFKEDRQMLVSWTENKSTEELIKYRKEKNSTSIDGFDTGL